VEEMKKHNVEVCGYYYHHFIDVKCGVFEGANSLIQKAVNNGHSDMVLS
jgi:hypothetical protein